MKINLTFRQQLIWDRKSSPIVDPFSGIGTTCITAKKFGFNYTRSEINEKYCNLSNELLKSI